MRGESIFSSASQRVSKRPSCSAMPRQRCRLCSQRPSSWLDPAEAARRRSRPPSRRGDRRRIAGTRQPGHVVRFCRCGRRPKPRSPSSSGRASRRVLDRRAIRRRRLRPCPRISTSDGDRNRAAEPRHPSHPSGLLSPPRSINHNAIKLIP
jgi:hypothetical protein